MNQLGKCYRAVFNGNDNSATWAKIHRLTRRHERALEKEAESAEPQIEGAAEVDN